MADVLPNAPLAEAVVEMRWNGLSTDVSYPLDPGYAPLFDHFHRGVKRQGFDRRLPLMKPTYNGLINGISERFFQKDSQFPILQIGHGIYAANESAGYDWPKFKKLAIEGAMLIQSGYPKLDEHPLQFNYLELRYIDVIELGFLKTKTYAEFLSKATNVSVEVPSIWSLGETSQKPARLRIGTILTTLPDTQVSFEIADAKRNGISIVRMETKVVKTGNEVISIASPSVFRKQLNQWLEAAHSVTSPAFKQIMSAEAHNQFEQEK